MNSVCNAILSSAVINLRFQNHINNFTLSRKGLTMEDCVFVALRHLSVMNIFLILIRFTHFSTC